MFFFFLIEESFKYIFQQCQKVGRIPLANSKRNIRRDIRLQGISVQTSQLVVQ